MSKYLIGFAIGVVLLVLWLFSQHSEIVHYKNKDAEQTLQLIKFSLIKFREDHGRYPSEAEGLRSLVDTPEQEKYLISKYLLLDPWLREVVYRPYMPPDKEGFLIYSLGPSGIDKAGQGDNLAVRSSQVTAHH